MDLYGVKDREAMLGDDATVGTSSTKHSKNKLYLHCENINCIQESGPLSKEPEVISYTTINVFFVLLRKCDLHYITTFNFWITFCRNKLRRYESESVVALKIYSPNKLMKTKYAFAHFRSIGK